MGNSLVLTMEYILAVIIGIVFILTFIHRRKRRDLPPGPFSLPLIGSVGFLWNSSRTRKGPHKVFAEAGKQYGPVMSVWIGPKLLVVLNGYDIIKQAFVQQASDLSDRPNWISQIRNATKIGKGISWSNGQEWKKIRKFTMKHLREYGYGTKGMEQTILDEIEKVSKVMLESQGESITIGDTLKYAVTNVICSLLYGQTFSYDDDIFRTLLRYFEMLVKGKGFTSITNFIPEFMYPLFPNENELHLERKRNTVKMRDYFEKLIDEHEDSFDNTLTRDFLDYYIKVKNGVLDEDLELSKESFFNQNNIYRVINDLFMSGSQTTATTMQWFFLYMIEYPSVQSKCRNIIRDVVGERNVQLSDRVDLPYIEATIQEIQRLSNVTPLGVPRTNTERDIFINGFRIPKKTIIIANLYSSHMDTNFWNDPGDFKPERFLNSKGELVKRDAFIPLSIGPRNCPAESLVKIELFLMLATLLQRFYFLRDENDPPHDFSPKPGQFITLAPNLYRVKVVPV